MKLSESNLTEVLSEGEVEALIKAAYMLRDKVMVAVAYEAGLMVSSS